MKCSSATRSTMAFLAGAAICLVGAAPATADGHFGLKASDCQIPGVIAWFSGNAISSGMSYNPCPNPIPLPAPVATPAPVDTPAPTPVEAPAPAPDEASPPPDETASSAPDETPAPAPVAVVEPPHVRIPVAVPTYVPSSRTIGPGSNAVGNGNGTSSYYNPYNEVAPSSRALASGADWCRRSDRSKSAIESCLKSIGNR